MGTDSHFDLDAYIANVCKTARVKPDSEICISNLGCSITIKQILKIVLVQNWNPFRYPNANFPCKGKSDFSKLLNNFEIESGLPSAQDIAKYLGNELISFNVLKFITEMSYSYKIDSDLSVWPRSRLLCFFYKETDIVSKYLARILGANLPHKFFVYEEPYTGGENLALFLGANLPYHDVKSEIYCNEYNDEMLHALFFGCKKGCLPEFPRGKTGLIKMRAPFWTITLLNFQAAGKDFRQAVVRFINQGSYNLYGDRKIRYGSCNIVCKITGQFDTMINSVDPEVRPDLQCKSKSKAIFLYPLRYRRADIPMHLYLHVKSKLHDAKREVLFPYILLRYWLIEEKWGENYNQLSRELDGYIDKFIQIYIDHPQGPTENPEMRKKVFFDLISTVDNPGFRTYISKFAVEDLEPYELISSEEFVEKPYFYFALRHFNKSSNCWEILEDDLDKLIFDGYWLGLTQFGDIFKRKNMGLAPVDRLENNKAKDETETENVDEDKKGPSRPKIPKGALDSIIPLTILEDFDWRNLRVGFGEENCAFDFVRPGSLPLREVRTYKEMGFENQKSHGKPIQEYFLVLGKLADGNGKLPYNKKSHKSLPQQVEIANTRLRALFEREENLVEFEPVRGDPTKLLGYYYTKFKFYRRG